ncbi:hypothetical protein [Deinococcus multiflagellatus]|uniref:Uncharacterized protein n=1 Tax=Deinococcus multiflagellatus TaxID=1656887 RepID=A0ABW1ZKN8_9DEIO|nr:hypothetical protein [Deinococcus multiflagellatus]MBZ9715760.1 hypothetical protein [Deinococcus multiflagellatus]
MNRLLTTLLCCLSAAALGSARAACVVQQAQVQLPAYSAQQASLGQLNITVLCQDPGDEAVLELEGPALRVSGDDLLLSLRGRGEALALTVPSAAPLRTGLRIMGTQTLSFPLRLAADQWVPVGDYDLHLTLLLRPVRP